MHLSHSGVQRLCDKIKKYKYLPSINFGLSVVPEMIKHTSVVVFES